MNVALPQLVLVSLAWAAWPLLAAPDGFSFRQTPGRVEVLLDQKPVATYVFQDAQIGRPYFAHLHTPGGIQVTRHHPPVPGQDPVDHATMHPGLWLAFGDINGHDYWRNKARVDHVRFLAEPQTEAGRGTFTVLNRYLDGNGQSEVCREQVRYTLTRHPTGTLLVWQSEISAPNSDLSFGPQEEMGLGVRVASPLRVKGGSGTIRNSLGGRDESATWGKEAAWWSYAGLIGEQQVGVLIVPSPANTFPSWGHTRDYGLVVVNPFPRPEKNTARVVVKRGDTLRLAYAVLLHERPANDPLNLDSASKDCLRVLAEK